MTTQLANLPVRWNSVNALESVLVVVPGEVNASPALERALTYARQTGAMIHLCSVVYCPCVDYAMVIFGPEVGARARGDFIEEQIQKLSPLTTLFKDQGVRCVTDVIWASRPYEAVLARILQLQPDLVIKDNASQGAAGDLQPSMDDWGLLRLSPAPVMLVRGHSRPLPGRVLASVDAMRPASEDKLNTVIIDTARSFAELGGAVLNLVSVFLQPPDGSYRAGFVAEARDLMDSAHRQAFEQLAACHGMATAYVRRIVAKDVVSGISAFVEENKTELVVIGFAHSGRLEQTMFGVTADALLRDLNCDVLLVKRPGFVEELAKVLALGNLSEQYRECPAPVT